MLRLTIFIAMALGASVFGQGYFPRGSVDDFRSRWYGKQLRALGEAPLTDKFPSEVETVFRFTWLRTFHRPISIRVAIRKDRTATLVAKITDGRGGYEPGTLVVDSTREIGSKEVDRILGLIEAFHFWGEPTVEDTGTIGLDGAQWILEGARAGEYHVVDRWSPANGPLRELGLHLVRDLARLPVSNSEVY